MANVNLRGLNLSATLVMINSKRNTLAGVPAESGDSYVDINLIPQIVVERIEILKEGATSLYGSDAIAGVVNFLTYQRFEGNKLKLSNQKTQHYGQDDRKIEFLHGSNINDINFILGFEILNRSSLPSKKIDGISELGISIFGNTFLTKEDGTFETLSKKEKLRVDRTRAKLEKNLGSITSMTRLPGALFVVDIRLSLIHI